MEKKEEKKTTIGRALFKGIFSYGGALGAGVLVGGVAMTVAEMLPCGKIIKGLCKFGAIGLQIATTYTTQDVLEEYVDNIYQTIDNVKLIGDKFSEKAKANAVPVDGTVK